MMREDKFVQVHVNVEKTPEQIVYHLIVHPSLERPKGCFSPTKIGEIILEGLPDQLYTFTLKTAMEWEQDAKLAEKNCFCLTLFASSITKLLNQIVSEEIPELSFLAGKLKYGSIENVIVDWSKTNPTYHFAGIIFDYKEKLGIPDLEKARSFLSLTDTTYLVNKQITIVLLMPVNDSRCFTAISNNPITSFHQINQYLWWSFHFDHYFSKSDFVSTKLDSEHGYNVIEDILIYTRPTLNIEDVPIPLWDFIKKHYNFLPPFFDEESFSTALILSKIKNI